MILLTVLTGSMAARDVSGASPRQREDERRDGARNSSGIELFSPMNVRVVNTVGVDLEWNVTGGNPGTVVFDVYVSENENEVRDPDPSVR